RQLDLACLGLRGERHVPAARDPEHGKAPLDSDQAQLDILGVADGSAARRVGHYSVEDRWIPAQKSAVWRSCAHRALPTTVGRAGEEPDAQRIEEGKATVRPATARTRKRSMRVPGALGRMISVTLARRFTVIATSPTYGERSKGPADAWSMTIARLSSLIEYGLFAEPVPDRLRPGPA